MIVNAMGVRMVGESFEITRMDAQHEQQFEVARWADGTITFNLVEGEMHRDGGGNFEMTLEEARRFRSWFIAITRS
jgi:hypothetical protein